MIKRDVWISGFILAGIFWAWAGIAALEGKWGLYATLVAFAMSALCIGYGIGEPE